MMGFQVGPPEFVGAVLQLLEAAGLPRDLDRMRLVEETISLRGSLETASSSLQTAEKVSDLPPIQSQAQ